APAPALIAARLRLEEVVLPGSVAGLQRAGVASQRRERHRVGHSDLLREESEHGLEARAIRPTRAGIRASPVARRAAFAPTFRTQRERVFPVAQSLSLPGRLACLAPANC